MINFTEIAAVLDLAKAFFSLTCEEVGVRSTGEWGAAVGKAFLAVDGALEELIQEVEGRSVWPSADGAPLTLSKIEERVRFHLENAQVVLDVGGDVKEQLSSAQAWLSFFWQKFTDEFEKELIPQEFDPSW